MKNNNLLSYLRLKKIINEGNFIERRLNLKIILWFFNNSLKNKNNLLCFIKTNKNYLKMAAVKIIDK